MKKIYLLSIALFIGLLFNSIISKPGPNSHVEENILPLYITVGEAFKLQFSDYIHGYNLNYSIEGPETELVKISSKFLLNEKSDISAAGFSVKTYHTYSAVNGDWESLWILSEDNKIYTGRFDDEKKAPKLTLFTTLSDPKNVKCFDFVKYFEIIVVDCMYKEKGAQGWRNLWHIVQANGSFITKEELEKKSYTSIDSRKLELLVYHDLAHILVMRGVVRDDNTSYIQSYKIMPTDVVEFDWTINKDTIKKTQFSLADFVVFENVLYLLNYIEGEYAVYRIEDKDKVYSFSLYHEVDQVKVYRRKDGELRVIVGHLDDALEINWNVAESPSLETQFETRTRNTVNDFQIDGNDKYIIIKGISAAEAKAQSYIDIYQKPQTLSSHIYLIYDYSKLGNCWILFNGKKNILLIISEKAIMNYEIINQYAFIFPQEDPQKSYHELKLKYISLEPSSGENKTDNYTVPIYILQDNNSTIQNLNSSNKTIYCYYPGECKVDVGYYFAGPAMDYAVDFTQVTKEEAVKPKSFLSTNDEKKQESLRDPPAYTVHKIEKDEHFNMAEMLGIQDPSTIGFMKGFPAHETMKWFIQLNNFTLYAFSCATQTTEPFPKCSPQWTDPLNLAGKVLSMDFAHSEDESSHNIFFGIVTEDNVMSAVIYRLDKTAYGTVHFENSWENEITSFRFTTEQIFIVRRYSKEVLIYHFVDLPTEMHLLAKIDEALLKNLGISYFGPLEVDFTESKPNQIFIKSETTIIVVDIASLQDIKFINEIDIKDCTRKLGDYPYFIDISENSLLCISPSTNIIQEISITDLSNRYEIIKSYPRYNYNLKPLFVCANTDSHLLYVQAEGANGETSILIYDSYNFKINVLYAIIPLEKKVTNLKILASGTNLDYLLIVADNNAFLYGVHKLPKVLIAAPYPFDGRNFTFKLTAKNTFSNKTETSNLILKVWDTYVNITDNNKSETVFKTVKKQEKFKVSVSWDNYNDWFKGSALYWDFNCTDCKKKINMTATIEAKQDLVKTKFNDVVIGKDHIFLLSDRSIDIYQKESKNKTSTFVIPGSDSYKCNKFAIHETLNYLAVKCTADLSHQLLIINITKIDNIVAFKDIFDLDSYYVRKMLFKEDNLYILDGPEDPLSESSIIYVLHIALSETHPHELFELVDIINGEKVDEDFLYISDFDAVKAEGQLPGDQKLFFVDAKFGIRIIDIRPTESWYEEPSDPLGNQLNLSSIIAKDGNSREAIYYGVKVLSGKSINVNVSNYQVVFTTKNSQNYELFINVTIKSYEHVKCQSHIEKAFAVRSLYRYAGFTAAPVLEASVVVNKDKANIMDDGYLLMPYYFESENFMPGPLASQVILLYDLQSYSNKILNESSYFYQYAIGGFRIPIKSFDYSFKLLSYKDKETKENIYEAILLNPYTSIAQVLSISRNLTLLFNATDLNSTKITFTAKNDYSQSSTTFPIDYFVEENSNDKTWIIFLVLGIIIVGILILIAIRVFTGKPKETKDSEKSLLQQPN